MSNHVVIPPPKKDEKPIHWGQGRWVHGGNPLPYIGEFTSFFKFLSVDSCSDPVK